MPHLCDSFLVARWGIRAKCLPLPSNPVRNPYTANSRENPLHSGSRVGDLPPRLASGWLRRQLNLLLPSVCCGALGHLATEMPAKPAPLLHSPLRSEFISKNCIDRPSGG